MLFSYKTMITLRIEICCTFYSQRLQVTLFVCYIYLQFFFLRSA